MNLKHVRGVAAKWGAGVGAMVATGAAMAQTDLSTDVVTELATGKTQLYAIGAAVLALVVIVSLIRHVRSAAR